MLRTLACLIVGHRWHEPDPYVSVCRRCNHVWDLGWEDDDSFQPWYGVIPWLKRFIPKITDPRVRCDQCKKKLWRWPRRRFYGDTFCSKKCCDEWLPF